MKNLQHRQGFKNRHTDGLPNRVCPIYIVKEDEDGEHLYLCEWTPYNPDNYAPNDQPAPGYLGTAKVIFGRYKGIGFHCWEQNDYEFIYYSESLPPGTGRDFKLL